MIEKIGGLIELHRSIELDNAFYVEDGTWIESLTVTADERVDIEAVITDISGVSLFSSQEFPNSAKDATVKRVLIIANESYPFILGLVLRQEAIPNRIVFKRGRFHVVATVRNWEQFRTLADEVQEKLGHFDLLKVTNIDRPGEPLDSGRLSEVLITKMTREQLEVLKVAYDMGYFEVPRQCSATEVAANLGIGQSTFSERLRTAENKLFQIIFGSR